MPIRCPNCGFDNRDTAKFCSSCGQQSLSAGAGIDNAPLHIPPIQPQADGSSAPLVSQISAAVVPIATRMPPATAPTEAPNAASALLTGSVETYNESEVHPPASHSWMLTKVGILAAVLPFVLSFAAGLSLILLVLVLFGGMVALSLIAIIGKAFGLVGMVLRLLLPRRGPVGRRTMQVSLGIQDSQQSLHRVVLYGDQIGGLLRQGDIVAVYGRRRRTGWIRAHRVVIIGRQLTTGAVQPVTIKGRRALPWIVPIVIWIATIGVWLWMFSPLLLDSLNGR